MTSSFCIAVNDRYQLSSTYSTLPCQVGRKNWRFVVFRYMDNSVFGNERTMWPSCLLYCAAWMGVNQFAGQVLDAACCVDPEGPMIRKPQLTPLHLAVRHAHRNIIGTLLSHESNTTFLVICNRPILFTAMLNIPEFSRCLFNRAKLNSIRKDNLTPPRSTMPLIGDAQLPSDPSLNWMQILRTAKISRPLTLGSCYLQKPGSLHFSAVCGSEAILKLILAMDHDLDRQESMERTALHPSTRSANMAGILLNHAPNPNSTVKYGHTSIMLVTA